MVKFKKLGDLCYISSGGTPKRTITDYWDNGKIPWVKISDIKSKHILNTDERITKQGLENSSAKLFPKDTIVYTIFATVGEVGILDITAATNQAIAGIQVKDRTQLRVDYLYYFLKSIKKSVQFLGRGVAQNNINLSVLKSISVPIPSFQEQTAIVKVLDSLNGQIKNKHKQLTLLSQLIKARFVELFGDLTTNNRGWKTENFSCVFENITSSKRILKSEWKSNGIPFLRVRDLVQLSEKEVLNNEFFISSELYSRLSDNDGVPKNGDILVSATSTLGKCHIVNSNEKLYFKDADVLRFRPSNKINAVYFTECMNDHFIQGQIEHNLGVTTVKHFTIKAAKSILIRIPPLSLQNEFANFVQQVDKSKVAVQKSLEETQTLFDSLMQKYFG